MHKNSTRQQNSGTSAGASMEHAAAGNGGASSAMLAWQQLLFMCTRSLQLESQVTYFSAALFDEALAVALSDTAVGLPSMPSGGHAAKLHLMSLACILIALDKFWPEVEEDHKLQVVMRAVEAGVHSDHDTDQDRPSEQELPDVKTVLLKQLQLDDSRPLVTDYVEQFYQSRLLQGLPDFASFVDLPTAHRICDVLLASGHLAGYLKSGGKLMAAAIIAAAWMIQVPLEELPALPPMGRLERLCQCPAAVVEAQAQLIMQLVLDVIEG